MLKTKVKASSVTNLTDARYFAAWEVEWLGFNFDPGADTYIQPQEMKAIKEWVDGVRIVGEFNLQTAAEVREAADLLELDAAQLGMFADTDSLSLLHSQEIPLLKEIILQDPGEISSLKKQLEEQAPYVEAFLFNFDKNGIHWNAFDEAQKNLLAALSQRFPILLSIGLEAGQLEEILETINPYGLNVRGGEEEKVGFKSFDELDDIFEALETFE